jgi:hypothetical protein
MKEIEESLPSEEEWSRLTAERDSISEEIEKLKTDLPAQLTATKQLSALLKVWVFFSDFVSTAFSSASLYLLFQSDMKGSGKIEKLLSS